MKTLRQLIFMFVAVIGLSMAVSAQKKPPPKDPPPVINPGQKPPRGEKPPKGEDKPKKPSMAFFIASKENFGDLV